MQINSITPLKLQQLKQQNLDDKSAGLVENQVEAMYMNNAKGIPFTAIHNIKPKKLNIKLESEKIIRKLSEILNTEVPEMSLTDMLTSSISKMLGQFKRIEKRKDELISMIEGLEYDKTLKPQAKLDKYNYYHKEYMRLCNTKISKPSEKAAQKVDDTIDFSLLNRMKAAISKGDYNLSKVYKDYYSGLLDARKMSDVETAYPKIVLPKRPENVVSRKFADSLPREFYEALDDLMSEKNLSPDAIYEMSDREVQQLCKSLGAKYNKSPEDLYEKLAVTAHHAILDKFVRIKDSVGFASIPYKENLKPTQYSKEDVELLTIDFDDFVINTLQKMYLNGEKPSSIIYEANGVKIPVRSLSNTEYKIEKPSEKYRQFVSAAEKIREAQRDYKNFDQADFTERLTYYAGTKLGSNEEILTGIVDFDSCRYTDDDVKMLTKFLEQLDSVQDGKISLDEALSTIRSEGLRPRGTENLNALERQQKAEALKLENAQIAKMTAKQDDFDDMINFLYKNNLNTIANTCSKYRPESMKPEDLAHFESMQKIVSRYIAEDGSVTNRVKLETSLSRWDTYEELLKTEPDSEILRQARNFATGKDGSLDVEKAGQYIMNSDIIAGYPQSVEFVNNPDVLTKIMNRSSSPEEAVKSLIKFEDYSMLEPEDKSKLVKIIENFDLKESVDKAILKFIVEQDYINVDTAMLTRLNDKGSETVKAVIKPSAKHQILEKYKFPLCLEYMTSFENALSSSARSVNDSGIKKTGTNNKSLPYKMELKIMGHDDRLFASETDYVFDVFSPVGLH